MSTYRFQQRAYDIDFALELSTTEELVFVTLEDVFVGLCKFASLQCLARTSLMVWFCDLVEISTRMIKDLLVQD